MPESEDLPCTCDLHRLRTMAVCKNRLAHSMSISLEPLVLLIACRCVPKGFFCCIENCILYNIKRSAESTLFFKSEGRRKMSKQRKRIFVLTGILALTFGMMTNVSAMHIMEGYLPGGFCIAWGALCIPFLVAGFLSIKKTLAEHKNLITLLAMSGAFVFVISSLKIPSVTGSCSHMTGTGLGAILFGPSAVSILGLIVLLFQAILLAHGGLTTIGANTFSMAIAGPFVSYGIFVLCKKAKVNKIVSVFLAATLGDLFTYCVTAAQMALAHNADTTFMAAMGKFLTVFAPTQVPLAIIEGIITVLIIQGLETYAKPELRAIGYLKEGK